METVTTSTTLAVRDELFTTEEQTALVGFLAGYSGLTREAYALDLRQYVQWCTEHAVTLFGARRADIESFGRHLEALGRAASHDRSPALHGRVLLPLRRRRRPDPNLTSGACAAAATRLRVPRHRAGPQRSRRHARRRGPRRRPRPRAHLPAGAQRAPRLRSDSAPTSSDSASSAATAP